ncbi:MAG TPA: STAS domain-containing protein [Rudaea sp.]|nr:STAS domain-containing protein [Rudaea sp.]
MAIDIQQEDADGTRILALTGRLDTETSADVELTLQDLLAAGEKNFLIDMTGIGYVSSAGLRVLLATAKQLEGGKGSLRLCSLNASVKQVFDVAGFSKLFSIFANRDAALANAPKTKKADKPKPDAAKAEQAKPAPKAEAPPAPKVEPAPTAEARKPAPPKPAPPPPAAPNPEPAKPAPKAEVPAKAEGMNVGIVLAQKIAGLWSLKLINDTPHPKAPELARIAAELMGVKQAVAAGGILPKASPAVASVPVAAPAPGQIQDDEPPSSGVIGKLRGLFGGKR